VLFTYTSSRPGALTTIRDFLVKPPAAMSASYPPRSFVSQTAVLGLFLSIAGVYIRHACYRELGRQFTFDLSIRENHKLITSGPYSIVRHPSYVGTMLNLIGATLSQYSAGSWWSESGLASRPLGKGIAAAWCFMTLYLSTLLLRAPTEDAMLRETFGEEWEAYAKRVRYWYIPGLI
jgi:protein-S-isoprenylcysteine O-methyltransferase Ste14